MLLETKHLLKELSDDLDLKIVELEAGQENYDIVYQAEQYQFIAGKIEAYTSVQNVLELLMLEG